MELLKSFIIRLINKNPLTTTAALQGHNCIILSTIAKSGNISRQV